MTRLNVLLPLIVAIICCSGFALPGSKSCSKRNRLTRRQHLVLAHEGSSNDNIKPESWAVSSAASSSSSGSSSGSSSSSSSGSSASLMPLSRRAAQKDDAVLASRLRGGGSANDGEEAVMSNGRRRGLFLLTYFAYIAIYLSRKPLSVVKPVLQEQMGMTTDALGGIDTALLGAYAIGQVMLGQATSLMTRRQMLTMGYIVAGLATAAVGLVDTSKAMAGLSALAGLASSCVNPLLVIFISELYPASMRASVVGLWCTSQQMGGIVANNFASSLLAAGECTKG